MMKKFMALMLVAVMALALVACGNNAADVAVEKDYAANVDGAAVVAEAGSAGEELATGDAFFQNAAFTPVDSMAKALMEVEAGTADIAIVDYVTSIGSIGDGTDFKDLVVVEAEDFNLEEYGIAFRKDSDATAKVNEIMADLIEDGTLKALAEKYELTLA